ncbi:MAG: hypothetical protein JXA74_04190 [Anaerolineae bacterium]|nr:hypothetical protein [Anaerolineae bacterium]
MSWKRGTLADFVGDALVYRNLEPMDKRVPGLRMSWHLFGMDHYYVPRKTTPEYAAALIGFLRQTQKMRGVMAPLQRVLFIGDTLMNDGTAARHVGQAYPMLGFIGCDRLGEPAKAEIQGDLMVANRWTTLAEYVDWVRREGFPLDQQTALLIDLDKTSLGARGRNDKVIDAARIRAVERTMRQALGGEFDETAFRAVYDPLNQPAYHHFTADNQDYLAYISLMVAGGAYELEQLWDDLRSGRLSSIEGFVAACDARRERMSSGLLAAHQEVLRGMAQGDPTPFKGFRRGEYFETVASMDVLDDDASAAQVLASEIVITAEVASVAQALAHQGVLVFGISDKPDEASVPTDESAQKGYKPIHQTVMKIVGEELGPVTSAAG